jgi:hypothetical protein
MHDRLRLDAVHRLKRCDGIQRIQCDWLVPRLRTLAVRYGERQLSNTSCPRSISCGISRRPITALAPSSTTLIPNLLR